MLFWCPVFSCCLKSVGRKIALWPIHWLDILLLLFFLFFFFLGGGGGRDKQSFAKERKQDIRFYVASLWPFLSTVNRRKLKCKLGIKRPSDLSTRKTFCPQVPPENIRVCVLIVV